MPGYGTCPCPNDLAAREGLKCPCQQQNPPLHLPSCSSLTVPQAEKEQEKCHGEGKRRHQRTTEGSNLEGTTPVPAWNFQQGCKNQSLSHTRDVNARHKCKGPAHRFAWLRDLPQPHSRGSGTEMVRSNLPLLQYPQLKGAGCTPLLLPLYSQYCGQVPVHPGGACVDQDRASAVNTEPGTGMGQTHDPAWQQGPGCIFGSFLGQFLLRSVLSGFSAGGTTQWQQGWWSPHTTAVPYRGLCQSCCLMHPEFTLPNPPYFWPVLGDF